jgi:hypothetical protein
MSQKADIRETIDPADKGGLLMVQAPVSCEVLV